MDSVLNFGKGGFCALVIYEWQDMLSQVEWNLTKVQYAEVYSKRLTINYA